MNTYATQLAGLAESEGLKLKATNNLGLNYAGSIEFDGGGYIIRANRADRKPRQRYTIAILMSYLELDMDGVHYSPIPIKLNYTTGFHNQKSLTIKSTEMALDLLVPKVRLAECIKNNCVDGLIYDDAVVELADIFQVPRVLIETRLASGQFNITKTPK